MQLTQEIPNRFDFNLWGSPVWTAAVIHVTKNRAVGKVPMAADRSWLSHHIKNEWFKAALTGHSQQESLDCT